MPVPLTLEVFEIRQGRVVYDDRKEKRRIVLGRIDQRVGLSMDRALRDVVTKGRLVLGDISVQTKEVPAPLSGLEVTLSHDLELDVVSGTAKVNDLRLSLQKLSVAMSGTVTNFNDAPVLDLALRSDTLLVSDIVAEIPAAMAPGVRKVSAEGTVVVQLHVATKPGSKPVTAVSGVLKAQDVVIRHPDFPAAVNECSIDLAFSDTELNLRTLALTLGNNPVVARVAVRDFKEPVVDAAVKATVNLDDVKSMVALPEGVSVSGTVSAEIAAKGRVDPSNPAQMNVKGSVALKDVGLATPALGGPVKVNGTVALSPKAVAAKLNAVLSGSPIRLDATVANYLTMMLPGSARRGPRTRVDFTLTSPDLNVDRILPPPSAEQNAQTEEPVPSSDNPLVLAAPLPGVDVDGEVRCAKATVSGMTVTDFAVDIRHRSDIGAMGVRANAYGGRVRLDVDADVRNHKALKVGVGVDVDGVEANNLLSSLNDRFTGTTPLMRALRRTDNVLYGRMDLHADFNARGGTTQELQRSLSGTVKGSVKQGRIAACGLVNSFAAVVEKFYKVQDLSFNSVEGKLVLRNGGLVIDDFRLYSPVGDLGVSGTVGSDGSYDLAVSDRLSKSVSAKLVQAQNKGKDAAKGLLKGTALAGIADQALDKVGIPVDRDGRVTVNLAIAGTVAEPKVAPKGFGAGSSGGSSKPKSAKTQVTEAVSKEVGRLKEQAAEVVKEEAKKLEKEATKELEKALDSKSTEEVKKQAEDAKKSAKKALKKLF